MKIIRLSKRIGTLILTLFISISLVSNISVSASDEGAESKKEITVFHTNDVHSRVDNYSKLKAYVDKYDNKLLLDAGDTLHGLSFATLENGSSIVKIMNAIGYDAITPGNHDFNYGYLRLKELGQEANFPILAANIKKDNNSVYDEVMIKEINGIKVGVFGLSTPETTYKTNPTNVEGLDFGDKESIIETSKEMVQKLKDQGADVIIALMHMGIDTASEVKSTDIGENVDGIDLIIDGHSHSNLEDYDSFNNSHDTKIASTGEYLNNIGQVNITIDEEGNKEIEMKSVSMNDLSETSSEVDNLISSIKANQDVILSEVVGKTPIKLDGEREKVRWGHTNLGRLITSAMIDETGADIAMTNGGGIRASIDEGDITKGEVIEVLPFGNYIVTKKIKGSDILTALELGLVEGTGGFTHFAGMEVYGEKYTADDETVRWKINNVVINGELLDENKEYIVATNDFMAAGGDAYGMFKQYPTLNEYSSLDEALIKYISKISDEAIMSIDSENRLIEGEMPEESNNNGEELNNSQNKSQSSPTDTNSNTNNNTNNTANEKSSLKKGSSPKTSDNMDTDKVLCLILACLGAAIALKEAKKEAQ